MRIYTRTGDKGETGLVGGTRVSKDSARINLIGEVDELNAHIGLARVHSHGNSFDHPLALIQDWLFELGAELATPEGCSHNNRLLSEDQIKYLETSMDEMNESLPPLKHFILPGGALTASQLHVARCVCRRAERSLISFGRLEPVRDEAIQFLNRLSDWLFMAARTSNNFENVEDIKWLGREK